MKSRLKEYRRCWLLLIWCSLMLLVIHGLIKLSNMEDLKIPRMKNYKSEMQEVSPTAEKNSSLDIEKKLRRALDKATENIKKILVWQSLKTNVPPEKKLGWKCGSCIVTSNTSKINDPNTASVVILYNYTTRGLMPKKSQRRSDQLHVFRTGESPSYLIHAFKYNSKFADEYEFNATMSYRRDSDIYCPYFSSLNNKNIETNLKNIMKKKTKFAVALVSNCKIMPGSKLRMYYLNQLLAKLPMDGLGKCFGKPMRKSKNKTAQIQTLEIYKFYFAFENSYHCRDYITEKFFLNGIRANTLPVVMGATRGDYEAIVPSESFIHVEDFSSISKLVEYLKYLNSNDTAYLEYFKWRTKIKDPILLNREHGYCQLCRIINGINVDDIYHPEYNSLSQNRPLFTESMFHRSVKSISKWIKNDSKECLSTKFDYSNTGTIVPL